MCSVTACCVFECDKMTNRCVSCCLPRPVSINRSQVVFPLYQGKLGAELNIVTKSVWGGGQVGWIGQQNLRL